MFLYRMIMILALPIIVLAIEPVAFVKSIKGEVFSIKNDQTSISLKVGDSIYEKDKIQTSVKSRVGFIFEDNTLISIGANSEFLIEEFLFEPEKKDVKFVSNLAKGSMACLTGLISKINPKAMEIKAKSASIGIRGTYFILEVKE